MRSLTGTSDPRSVFVGGLDPLVTSGTLEAAFNKIGKVVHSSALCSADGNHAGGGRVAFATPEEAVRALSLDDSILCGRRVGKTVVRQTKKGGSFTHLRERHDV